MMAYLMELVQFQESMNEMWFEHLAYDIPLLNTQALKNFKKIPNDSLSQPFSKTPNNPLSLITARLYLKLSKSFV